MAGKFNIFSAGAGKGLNIFKSSAYKEHEQTPMARLFWGIRWAVAAWLVAALAFAMAFVIEHLWRYGWSAASAKWTAIYLKHMFMTGGISVLAEIPAWLERSVMRTDLACIAPLVPVIGYYLLTDATFTDEFNPHGKDKFDEKSSNKATASDIRKMGTDYKNKDGLFNGFMMLRKYRNSFGISIALTHPRITPI